MRKYFNQKSVLFLFLVVNFILVNSCLLVGSDQGPVTKRYYEVYDALVCAVLQNNVGEAEYLLKRGDFDPHQKIAFGYTLRHLVSSLDMDTLLFRNKVAPDAKIKSILVSAEVYTCCDGEESIVRGYIDRYELNPEDFKLFCIRKQDEMSRQHQASLRLADHYNKLASHPVMAMHNRLMFTQHAERHKAVADTKNLCADKFYVLSTGFSVREQHDPRSLDFRGFPPGHYSLAKRAEMAQSIRDGHFVMPVSEPLS